MKIVFKAQNGFCPKWEHDGTIYYLFEDYDGTWTLMSKKIGFLKKDKFYGKGTHRIHPGSLLKRFFKNKQHVRHEVDGKYSFYLWDGKRFVTDGETIAIMYIEQYERPSFDTYLECLHDAKEYLSKKYNDGQLSLFD